MHAAALMELMRGGEEHAVLDVRERGEAQHAHVAGASIVPRRLLESMLPDLVPGRATPVVFCDDDGTRAEHAAYRAIELGYAHAGWLEGGMSAWRAAGGEVAQGTNVPSKRFGEQVARAMEVPQLAPQALRQWLEDRRDVVICDARTAEEYRRGTIPGAVSVPSFDLSAQATRLLERHEAIIVNCAGRTRSIVGAQTLRELGHDRVFALENGTMGWLLAGFALEEGASRTLAMADADPRDAEMRARQWARREGIEFVPVQELAHRGAGDESNEQVLDVRALDQYIAGHIPGAKPVPSGQLVQRADDFIAVRSARIVLVDSRESRAIAAAVWLKRMAWGRPVVLEGGMEAWEAAGNCLAQGRRPHQWSGLETARGLARSMTAEDLHAAMRRSEAMTIVSVDSSSRYREGHIRGAVWLPRARLETRAAQGLADRARTIAVSCRDGIQSAYAAATLLGLGYRDVRVLDGGVASWIAQGLAIERGGEIEDDGDVLLPPYARGPEAMRAYLEWEQRL